MYKKVQLVRLLGACLCLLLSGAFCHAFSSFQVNALVHGAGIPLHALPVICLVFARYSIVSFLVPPVLLAVGLYRLFNEPTPSAGVELWSSAALVLAFALLVACILAWQLPYTLSSAGMI